MKKIIFIICVVFFFPVIPLAGFDDLFNTPDFSTPASVSNLVFNFFHHSCGANLLGDGLAAGLANLGYELNTSINQTYFAENNYTDYRHWYKRFQRELGIQSNGIYYRYEGPDALGNPRTGAQINSNEFMLTWYEDHNHQGMDIIMFKPCYPGSAVSGYDTRYDGTTGNNGYGNVIAGTPYSDSGTNNFIYLNSTATVDAGYTADKWNQGVWNGSASSLAQLKCAYRGMLNIFVNHPDKLFIAMTAPPMKNLTPSQASNCRKLARWFREDWLHQYDPTGKDQFRDYPLNNVVPFDFHNSIARTTNDAFQDNRYFWFAEGGFPDDTQDPSTAPASREVGEQNGQAGDDHPDAWLNQRTSVIFCGGKDTTSSNNTGMVRRTYYSWINGMVNRWKNGTASSPGGPAAGSVPAVSAAGRNIFCCPTLVNLNITSAVRIVAPSLGNSRSDVFLLNMKGDLIKKISNVLFQDGVYTWDINYQDQGLLPSGPLLIRVKALKTAIVIVK